MPGLVNQQQQTAFLDPQNGQSPIDADQVRVNDEAVRLKHNAHDADPTTHVQSSTLAARPAFGTAQRLWVSTDGKRIYLDSGTAWDEIGYVPLGGGTLTGLVIFPAGTTALPSFRVPHGVAPTTPTDGDVWTTSAGIFIHINGTTVGPLGSGGGGGVGGTGTANKMAKWSGTTTLADSTLTDDGTNLTAGVRLITVATAAGGSGFRLPHGTAPTTPTDGDVWTTTAGMFARILGSTIGPFGAGGGGVSGSGTSGKYARWSGATSLVDAILSESASVATLTGNFFPEADGTRDLGAAATRWNNLYANKVSAGAGALTLAAGSADRFNVSAAGHLLANTDNASDIGASGATRPRDLFLARHLTMAGNLAVTGTGTFVGLLSTAASAAGGAGLVLPHGTAPTSPNNGDVWTTTDGLFLRINGTTIGPIANPVVPGTVNRVPFYSSTTQLSNSTLLWTGGVAPSIGVLSPATGGGADLGSASLRYRGAWAQYVELTNYLTTNIVSAQVGSVADLTTALFHVGPYATPALQAKLATADLLSFYRLDINHYSPPNSSPLYLNIDGAASGGADSKLMIGAVQVVRSRRTGWATATGTATRTTFDTATVTTAQLAERIKALIDDLHGTAGHGLIGT